MKSGYWITFCLFLVFNYSGGQVCNQTPLSADPIPPNPGITDVAANAALGARDSNPACSELVQLFLMGSGTPSNPRTNCPHLRADLTPFHSRFPSITPGQNIVLGPTDKLLMSACSTNVSFGKITVPSGAVLVINDQDMVIRAREIKVETGGVLLAGSSTCRLFSEIDFVFLGKKANSSPSVPTGTSKGLVSAGRTEIFGKQYHPTFTRLAVTAQIDDTIIFLQDPVNWEVGQKILLTTTTFFDCPSQWASFCNNQPHQNEIRTIVAISTTAKYKGQAIKLSQPLNFNHYSGPEYSGEVALLSRRIRFLGGDNSSSDEFGGHTRIETETGIGKFGGIQADQMGQLNVLGRYPFHFHMVKGFGNLSSIEDCSVTNSFFRAYTVHGTNFTRLSRNIGFNIKGFAVYLEDGVEENNRFEFNLMSHVHPILTPADGNGGQRGNIVSQQDGIILNPADISASGYYVSNAFNDFIGNVASGGWSGFAFPTIPKPLGLFNGLDFGNNNPENRPTKSFVGNQAHSQGFYWREHGSGMYAGALLQVVNGTLTYDSGRHKRTTINSDGSDAVMEFLDTKAWATNKGVAHWGDNVNLIRYEAHDFGQASAMLFGAAAIIDALLNAKTRNVAGWTTQDSMKSSQFNLIGFQFYDTAVKTVLSRITIRNITLPGAAINLMDRTDRFLPQGMSGTRGFRFENVQLAARFVSENCGADCDGKTSMSARIQNLWDFDGTASGTGLPSIIGTNHPWWNVGSDCVLDPNWKQFKCNWTTNRDISHFTFRVPGLIDDPGCLMHTGVVPRIKCENQNANYTVGTATVFGKPASAALPLSPWPGITGMSSNGWHLRPKLSTAPFTEGGPEEFSIGPNIQIRPEKFIVMSMTYPANTVFSVSVVDNIHSVVTNLPMSTKAKVFTSVENLNDPAQFNCVGKSNFEFCTNTGGPGMGAWHFDGNNFFLRVVNPFCYTKLGRDLCGVNYFRDGVNIPKVASAFSFRVTAQCVGCPRENFNGNTYFQVVDKVPAAFPVVLGTQIAPLAPTRSTVRVCNKTLPF